MRTTGFVIAGVVAVAAIAVVLAMKGNEGEMQKLREESASATDLLDSAHDTTLRLDTELAGERRRAQRAEIEVARLRTEVESVKQKLADAAQAAAQEPAPGPADWRDAVERYPVYEPEGLGDALETVDWEVVAESMSNMPPLIA